MKSTTIGILLFIVIVAVGTFFVFGAGGSGQITGNAVNSGTGGTGEGSAGGGNVQKITLSIKNSNYYPQVIKASEGVPVELILDSSVSGCLRGFVISDLGVRANSRSPSDTIKFTPTKKGTFRFSCPMGMGTGTIVVE